MDKIWKFQLQCGRELDNTESVPGLARPFAQLSYSMHVKFKESFGMVRPEFLINLISTIFLFQAFFIDVKQAKDR